LHDRLIVVVVLLACVLASASAGGIVFMLYGPIVRRRTPLTVPRQDLVKVMPMIRRPANLPPELPRARAPRGTPAPQMTLSDTTDKVAALPFDADEHTRVDA
jgi:hypothetical protein